MPTDGLLAANRKQPSGTPPTCSRRASCIRMCASSKSIRIKSPTRDFSSSSSPISAVAASARLADSCRSMSGASRPTRPGPSVNRRKNSCLRRYKAMLRIANGTHLRGESGGMASTGAVLASLYGTGYRGRKVYSGGLLGVAPAARPACRETLGSIASGGRSMSGRAKRGSPHSALPGKKLNIPSPGSSGVASRNPTQGRASTSAIVTPTGHGPSRCQPALDLLEEQPSPRRRRAPVMLLGPSERRFATTHPAWDLHAWGWQTAMIESKPKRHGKPERPNLCRPAPSNERSTSSEPMLAWTRVADRYRFVPRPPFGTLTGCVSTRRVAT